MTLILANNLFAVKCLFCRITKQGSEWMFQPRVLTCAGLSCLGWHSFTSI